MISSKLVIKEIKTIDDFLELYKENISHDFQNILKLNFQIKIGKPSQKISPIIQLAKPEDSKEIAQIFRKIYKGTYPYKQMEDDQEVEKMIIDPNYQWFLFKINSIETVGCFGSHLEFENKRGFLYGFIIKKRYQNTVDIFKAFIGCVIFLWKTYKSKILLWYGEMRTNESSSQFFTSLIGLKPIAFFPNKDIFFNQIESDVLHVIYDEKALYKYRRKKNPKIIRQVLNCYVYSNRKYHLGTPIIKNPNIKLNSKKLKEIKGKIIIRKEKDKFGIEVITLSIKNSNSYFKFIYNPLSRNFEKTIYKINLLEELFTFIQKLKELIQSMEINYFECFVSSYEPKHQKIFLDAGFNPRGYIPCWKYNKEKNHFEDQIVFNFYKGKIDDNIKLIPEAIALLQTLKFFEE